MQVGRIAGGEQRQGLILLDQGQRRPRPYGARPACTYLRRPGSSHVTASHRPRPSWQAGASPLGLRAIGRPVDDGREAHAGWGGTAGAGPQQSAAGRPGSKLREAGRVGRLASRHHWQLLCTAAAKKKKKRCGAWTPAMAGVVAAWSRRWPAARRRPVLHYRPAYRAVTVLALLRHYGAQTPRGELS